MRITLTMAAIAATMATTAMATPTMHHHHATKTDSGSQAVKDLNEKSLQQANAGSTAQPMTPPAAMSDSGAAMPAPPAPPADAAMAPPARDPAMAPGDAMTPAPTTPQ